MGVERMKNDAHAIISKTANYLPKLRKQPLTPPHFNGSKRKYPTFCKDYERLMKPVHEDDPYVFRSYLSGEHWKSCKVQKIHFKI